MGPATTAGPNALEHAAPAWYNRPEVEQPSNSSGPSNFLRRPVRFIFLLLALFLPLAVGIVVGVGHGVHAVHNLDLAQLAAARCNDESRHPSRLLHPSDRLMATHSRRCGFRRKQPSPNSGFSKCLCSSELGRLR